MSTTEETDLPASTPVTQPTERVVVDADSTHTFTASVGFNDGCVVVSPVPLYALPLEVGARIRLKTETATDGVYEWLNYVETDDRAEMPNPFDFDPTPDPPEIERASGVVATFWPLSVHALRVDPREYHTLDEFCNRGDGQ